MFMFVPLEDQIQKCSRYFSRNPLCTRFAIDCQETNKSDSTLVLPLRKYQTDDIRLCAFLKKFRNLDSLFRIACFMLPSSSFNDFASVALQGAGEKIHRSLSSMSSLECCTPTYPRYCMACLNSSLERESPDSAFPAQQKISISICRQETRRKRKVIHRKIQATFSVNRSFFLVAYVVLDICFNFFGQFKNAVEI